MINKNNLLIIALSMAFGVFQPLAIFGKNPKQQEQLTPNERESARALFGLSRKRSAPANHLTIAEALAAKIPRKGLLDANDIHVNQAACLQRIPTRTPCDCTATSSHHVDSDSSSDKFEHLNNEVENEQHATAISAVDCDDLITDYNGIGLRLTEFEKHISESEQIIPSISMPKRCIEEVEDTTSHSSENEQHTTAISAVDCDDLITDYNEIGLRLTEFKKHISESNEAASTIEAPQPTSTSLAPEEIIPSISRPKRCIVRHQIKIIIRDANNSTEEIFYLTNSQAKNQLPKLRNGEYRRQARENGIVCHVTTLPRGTTDIFKDLLQFTQDIDRIQLLQNTSSETLDTLAQLFDFFKNKGPFKYTQWIETILWSRNTGTGNATPCHLPAPMLFEFSQDQQRTDYIARMFAYHAGPSKSTHTP